ncbi:MAG TPA: hypothetical protein VGT08_02530 [Terracidiphilus sp.]|nr:hypothetical protein [Terracidiphilus sp.]
MSKIGFIGLGIMGKPISKKVVLPMTSIMQQMLIALMNRGSAIWITQRL